MIIAGTELLTFSQTMHIITVVGAFITH